MASAFGRLADAQILKFIQCVCNEDSVQIRKFMKYGVPNLVNFREPYRGVGVLHMAAEKYNGSMTRYMLQMGAHPDTQDIRGCTPAMIAAELGHDLVLEILAEAQADMSIVDKTGKGILFYCMYPSKRHLNCFNIALEHGADVHNSSTEGKPVLLVACEQARDCAEICLKLLEKGANPNAFNLITGRTVLMEASREGAVDVVRAILQKGGEVNISDKQRSNAVHFAARGGHLEVLKVLSEYGVDVNAIDMKGNTALHCAAVGGFTECCKFLGQQGCNPQWKNLKDQTALVIAKSMGFKKAVRELKKRRRLAKKMRLQKSNTPLDGKQSVCTTGCKNIMVSSLNTS